MNPLFPSNKQSPQDDQHSAGYVLPHHKGRTIQPSDSAHHAQSNERNAAVNLIRSKLDALYAAEPDATTELAEAAQEIAATRSKHQQFMYELSTSGKSLAEIQTAWHVYYAGLSDTEKHDVWQEFYVANSRNPSSFTRAAEHQQSAKVVAPGTPPEPAAAPAHHRNTQPVAKGLPGVVVAEHAPLTATPKKSSLKDRRSVADIKKHLLTKVRASSKAQLKAKQHLQSLLFGVCTGAIVLLIFLFGFFNEVIIAPFIQPSRHVSETPLIVSDVSVAPSDIPEVIIPKINVQIPLVYGVPSLNEDVIQKGLETGVVHYPNTVKPGERGNTAFFGHSSNNIFNKGKYKFAFVLLHELEPGDVFYLSQNKKVYTYRVFMKKVVEPAEVSVLTNTQGKLATATLITCDPPGTSKHRLVVWGEQITPDPAGAVAPAVTPASDIPAQISSNGPTMWTRFIRWLF